MDIWKVEYSRMYGDIATTSTKVFNGKESAKKEFEDIISDILSGISDMEDYTVDKKEYSFYLYRDGFENEDNYNVIFKRLE